MNFEKLKNKVDQAENTLEANERRVGADLRQLKDSWRALWSPGRIIVVGMASGFLIGRAEPLQTVARSGGLLRMSSTLMSLFSGVTAASAASDAEDAEDAEEAVEEKARRSGLADDPAAAPAPRVAASADSARRQRRQLPPDTNDSAAQDYLERLASAARQAGGNG
ncbi:hypothetical protein [Lysobacter sp. A03]|uniref:hypothetical protein n=1 Tax=Lysobacter sp. A03 TaxID=1199154 RepID=UPI0005B6AE25|nr:hypothetical protein [Lysobacter sp. A03]KIQ98324.1 hypothetical protein TI01_0079 [Lysobacter sp. A03]